ncbi:MAG: hypothetical protein ACFB16_16650 [Phormidesmis sp.]
MPDKQKVTLYLSDALHRRFKIRSAVDGETMSSMAQRALEFYLSNAELVENASETHGQSHRIHSCPSCSAAVTLNGDKLALIREHANHAEQELVGLDCIPSLRQDVACQLSDDSDESKRPDEGELITC